MPQTDTSLPSLRQGRALILEPDSAYAVRGHWPCPVHLLFQHLHHSGEIWVVSPLLAISQGLRLCPHQAALQTLLEAPERRGSISDIAPGAHSSWGPARVWLEQVALLRNRGLLKTEVWLHSGKRTLHGFSFPLVFLESAEDKGAN